MVSKSIHFLACVIIFLILWISNIPYATFCYPLICWQAFHLFPHFDYCGYCSSEHWHVSIYSSHCLQFFWTSTKNEMVGSYDISMFSFLRKTLNYFPYGFTLYIPTSNVKGFWFSTSLPIYFVFLCVFSFVLKLYLPVTPWTVALPGSSVHGILQAGMGIFLTQGSTLDLPHCRQILSHWSYYEEVSHIYLLWYQFAFA